jgi:hypothetical protein
MVVGKASKRPIRSVEAHVDQFAVDLQPDALLRAVRTISTENAARIPTLLLRSAIVQTIRDDARCAKRDAALAAIAAGLRKLHGDAAGAGIERAADLIATVERGYWALSGELDELLAASAPVEWLWAVMDRAAELVDWSLGEIDRRAAAASMIDGSVFALPDGAGGEFRADELMAMIDATTSICIRMLAARHGWHDRDGAVVLPDRPDVTTCDSNAAKLTRLSELWEMWRRMETGARFLGCELREAEHHCGTVRSMVPSREAMHWRRLAHIAYEQLTAEITSVFNQLIYREDAHLEAVGIDNNAPLMPAAPVTASEIYAYHALEVLLAIEPREDTSQYLGLTLIEWLRGYSVLEQIASVAGRSEGKASRLLIRLNEPDLILRLVRLGLTADKAKKFITNVTFGRRSGDVVDDPIFRLADGQLLLLGPLILNCEITRTILSKFSRRQVQIGAKGRRFERRFREHLSDWGLTPIHGAIKAGREMYEVDAAIRLDRRLFLFECKTRSTFGVDPASVWRLREWMSQAATQTCRIATGLQRLPNALTNLLGEDCDDVEVIPCVVGAMPLEAPRLVDGAYFTDQMALAMFFAVGEAGVYATHRIPGLPPIRQTVFANRLWSGFAPTSEDLLRFLMNPPSVAMIGAHLREVEVSERHPTLGEFRTVELDILPANPSLSVAALGGVSVEASISAHEASEVLGRLAKEAKS